MQADSDLIIRAARSLGGDDDDRMDRYAFVLGSKSTEKSSAVAVSRSAPYVVAGGAVPNGQNLVVRWVLP